MTKEMKQYLETVVTSIVNEDSDAAKDAFHQYLRLKTQSILSEKEECDDECEDDKKNPFAKKDGDEGSGEEGSGEDEGSGKSEKKNPFAKKKD